MQLVQEGVYFSDDVDKEVIQKEHSDTPWHEVNEYLTCSKTKSLLGYQNACFKHLLYGPASQNKIIQSVEHFPAGGIWVGKGG